MSATAYKITIIGAGPAGCALAQILLSSDHSDRFAITIFEGEASPAVRSQGGTLDLHSETGLEAVRRVGLLGEFLRLARFDAEAITLCDTQLRRYISLAPSTAPAHHHRDRIPQDARRDIDREQLRHILLRSLPEGVIRGGGDETHAL